MTSATARTCPPRRRTAGDRLGVSFAEVRPALLQSLTAMLGSPDDAQDVLQETFLKCWRNRTRVWKVRNLRAWIYRVGMNAARDYQRNAWRRKSRPLSTQITLPDLAAVPPCDQLLDREDLDRVRQALTGLRTDEREVFLLRQNSDLTYDEIADKRRAPVGTVKTQMRAALQKLRAVLGKGINRTVRVYAFARNENMDSSRDMRNIYERSLARRRDAVPFLPVNNQAPHPRRTTGTACQQPPRSA